MKGKERSTDRSLAEVLSSLRRILFSQLDGTLYHIPCIFGGNATPAFTLNCVVETKIFGQFVL